MEHSAHALQQTSPRVEGALADLVSDAPWRWPEARWRQAVNKVRAGRPLTPATWPEGAQVAVACQRRFDRSVPRPMTRFFRSLSLVMLACAATACDESLKDFAGKTVVTPRRGPLAAQIAKAAPDVKLLQSTSYEESLALVLAGQADAAALNWQAGLRMARAKHPGKFTLPDAPYVSVPLSFAVAKGKNADLLAKIDSTITTMRADGAFKAIEEKWLGR